VPIPWPSYGPRRWHLGVTAFLRNGISMVRPQDQSATKP